MAFQNHPTTDEYVPHPQPSTSFWLAECGPSLETLTSFRSTDSLPTTAQIVIIGAGLTGISTAYWLTEQGVKDVVVLDARGVAECATGRNGGHLWAYTELPTSEEITRYGAQSVFKRHEFQFNTIKMMIDTIQKHKLDCDLKWTGAMNVALSEAENDSFKSYIRMLKSLGLEQSSATIKISETEQSTPSFSYSSVEDAQKYTTSPISKGGVACNFAGQCWPAKFVHGLTKVILERGVKLYTKCLANKVSRRWTPTDEYEVSISDLKKTASSSHSSKSSINIRCQHVVYATNGYSARLIPELKTTIRPTQGQILVTSPVKLSIPGNTWYDYGYLYMIQRPDGRLVLGGCRNKNPKGDEPTVDDSKINETVSAELQSFLTKNFPEIQKSGVSIEYEWTGIMGFTPDTLPMIGNLRGREWIAAGYTGYGMPKCFGAGKAIADMITGKLTQEEFVPQYNPSRYWPVSKL